MPAGYILKLHADTFRDYPPRQAPANFNPQAMLDSVLSAAAGGVGSR
jgi:arylsulfatase